MSVEAVALATALWVPAFAIWLLTPHPDVAEYVSGAVMAGLSGGILVGAWASVVAP